MRKSLLILFTFAFLLNAQAQRKNFWSAHSGTGNVTTHKAVGRASFPVEHKLFDGDVASFQQELSTIVDKNTNKRSTIITLPNADGGSEEFELTEASNFEPDLQARFPNIRSFSGKGITDRNATIKLSSSPEAGIQTMVFRSEKDNEYMEPYSEDRKVYAVFRSARKTGQMPWTCTTVDKQMAAALNQQVSGTSITGRSGADLKTMKLAQSCNGEYANYFKATSAADVALVLAAFNATLTRVNGVFEKDLALHLNLISATTNVIYYNPATDPYSTTLSQWNGQLQSTLTSVIGDANYDIGHMFGASGGGGNAGCIGCVCTNGSKGSGITSPADGIPQGDNFDIDYVVHEMGHQLGGNHSFSMSNEGSGVNVEPGSGITIMGYAGITSQDLAPHSIDIFHAANIGQIQTNLATKTCPVTTSIATTNATPVVDALTNYTIPISTPFALTGSATDANNDPLTYCWEQMDNASATQTGASSVASATKASGPNWISFKPTTSPTRYFPQLSTILAGANITGPLTGGDAGANIEALSSVARTLNFRLTVRDNVLYRSTTPVTVGQTNYSDVVVTVSSASGPFAVTAPNTAVSWAGGSTQNITWSVANTTASPVSCANVKISLSTDGGQTFPTVLAASTPNDGTESLVIPSTSTTTARIKVEAVGNIFFDISNTNFSITAPVLCGDPIGLVSSSLTNNSATVSWTAVSNALSYAVDYKLSTATTWTSFSTAQTATSANLTGLTANSAYNWRVTATCTAGAGNAVSANFNTAANCGDPTGLSSSSITNNSATVSWTAVANALSYAVDYKLSTATTWTSFTTAQTATSANLTGLAANSAYNWRVIATCTAGAGNAISANFTTAANCGDPTGLTSSAITSNSATVSWTPVTNALDYALDYKLSTATTWTSFSSALTTTSASLSGLTQTSIYNWRVTARCSAGTGNAVAAQFTTLTPTCQNSIDNSTNSTTAGAAVIPFNTDIKGLINVSNDIDNYKFTITTGGTIKINLTTLPTNYNLKLLNSAGTQLVRSQNSGTISDSISYTATPGIYYAQVYGNNSTSFNATSCYTLRVSLGTATKITLDLTGVENGIVSQFDMPGKNKGSIMIYPNPVQNAVNISLNGVEGNSEISIYNLNGSRLMSQKSMTGNTRFDLSGLPGGIYLIKVVNGNGVTSRFKIIKL